MDRTTPAVPVTDEQSMAARLTAEHSAKVVNIIQNWWARLPQTKDHRAKRVDFGDCETVIASLETLQKALLAHVETLQQETARLTAEAKVYGDAVAKWRPIVERVQQAEQQRDAAHAALKEIAEESCTCTGYYKCNGCVDRCANKADAALAASAPQKKCDHKFIDSNHCLKCGWKPAPAQETERGR